MQYWGVNISTRGGFMNDRDPNYFYIEPDRLAEYPSNQVNRWSTEYDMWPYRQELAEITTQTGTADPKGVLTRFDKSERYRGAESLLKQLRGDELWRFLDHDWRQHGWRARELFYPDQNLYQSHSFKLRHKWLTIPATVDIRIYGSRFNAEVEERRKNWPYQVRDLTRDYLEFLVVFWTRSPHDGQFVGQFPDIFKVTDLNAIHRIRNVRDRLTSAR